MSFLCGRFEASLVLVASQRLGADPRADPLGLPKGAGPAGRRDSRRRGYWPEGLTSCPTSLESCARLRRQSVGAAAGPGSNLVEGQTHSPVRERRRATSGRSPHARLVWIDQDRDRLDGPVLRGRDRGRWRETTSVPREAPLRLVPLIPVASARSPRPTLSASSQLPQARGISRVTRCRVRKLPWGRDTVRVLRELSAPSWVAR